MYLYMYMHIYMYIHNLLTQQKAYHFIAYELLLVIVNVIPLRITSLLFCDLMHLHIYKMHCITFHDFINVLYLLKSIM